MTAVPTEETFDVDVDVDAAGSARRSTTTTATTGCPWSHGSEVVAGHPHIREEALLAGLVLHGVDGHRLPAALAVLLGVARRFLDGLQVLLTLELSVEQSTQEILLVGCHLDKSITEPHERDGAIGISNCCEAAASLDAEGAETGIGDLLGQGNLVHAVIVVPDIQAAVLPAQEEDAWSRWTPSSGTEEGRIVRCLEHRTLQLLHPHLGTPVANTDEELRVERVTLHRVNRAEVSSISATIFCAEPGSDLDLFLGSLRTGDDETVLCADQELGGASLLHPLEGCSAKGLLLVLPSIGEHALVGELGKIPNIPEEQATIARNRGAFSSGLALQPNDIIDRVVV
mmetsp:Transcript_39003/g.82936  ORF Transcript_39003/g.82936 Transcript_39003/m.82936 type:complete len:342 (-) Transcript_39003:897-1922(-)